MAFGITGGTQVPVVDNALAGIQTGTVTQLADGRASIVPASVTPGSLTDAVIDGVFTVPKTANIALLKGGDIWWDVSEDKAHFKPGAGTPDFYVGVCVEDAAASATTVKVDLNRRARYTIDLHDPNMPGDGWTSEATLGLGVTNSTPPGRYTLEFDAVAEAAQAALYSNHGVPIAAQPIFEARIAVYNIGDNAALDIDVALASASHATDFESVANFAGIHLDGNALDIKVHSDDGTTDVAPVDSTIDAVDDTFLEVWVDARNPADVQIYVDGVDAVPSGTTLTLAAAANALKALVMIEKTNDDTVADVRVSRLRVRTSND